MLVTQVLSVAALAIAIVSGTHWECGTLGPPFEARFGAPMHATAATKDELNEHCITDAALLNEKLNSTNFHCRCEPNYDNYLFTSDCNSDAANLGKVLSSFAMENGYAYSKIHFGCMPISLNSTNDAGEPMWRYYGELPLTILDCRQGKLTALDDLLASL